MHRDRQAAAMAMSPALYSDTLLSGLMASRLTHAEFLEDTGWDL